MPGLVTVKLRRINVERRQGHLDEAARLYEEVLQQASDLEVGSFYAVRYARFLAKVM